jgi:hypothetical protein
VTTMSTCDVLLENRLMVEAMQRRLDRSLSSTSAVLRGLKETETKDGERAADEVLSLRLQLAEHKAASEALCEAIWMTGSLAGSAAALLKRENPGLAPDMLARLEAPQPEGPCRLETGQDEFVSSVEAVRTWNADYTAWLGDLSTACGEIQDPTNR